MGQGRISRRTGTRRESSIRKAIVIPIARCIGSIERKTRAQGEYTLSFGLWKFVVVIIVDTSFISTGTALTHRDS